MATANITFGNATTEEVRAANYKLNRINAVRVAHGEEEFATINDYIEDQVLNNLLPSWIAQESEARQAEYDVRELWMEATDVQRLAAINALTPSSGS